MSQPASSAKARLKQLREFHFFEKQQYIEAAGQAFIMLTLGLGFFFLSKLPTGTFRPLLVSIGPIFFRYSLFGNLFIILALRKLIQIQQPSILKDTLMLCILLFVLHGIASAFDPNGTYKTNVFLELLTSGAPILILCFYLHKFSKIIRSTVITIMGFLFTTLSGSFLLIYALGVLFSVSKTANFKFFTWLQILQTGGSLRATHFLLGLSLCAACLFLYFKRKRLIQGFAEMEQQLYLDK